MLFVPVPTPSPAAVVSPSPALTDVAPSLPTSPVPTPSNTGLVNVVVDHSTGFLGRISLGSWPDWVAAIFTSAAFIVAAGSYWRSVQVRREEQARLVYSKVLHVKYHDEGAAFEPLPHGAKIGNTRGPGITGVTFTMSSPHEIALVPVIQLTACVRNGSKELIGPAKVQVVNIGRKTTYDTFSVLIDVIDPETDYVVDFVLPNVDHPRQPSLGTTVLFRDASGQWWRRHLAEPIEAVHDDPENAAYTSAERATGAANLRALGIEPAPDAAPKVPLRARWHRFWRERRGKSPTP
ncbi:hypothetical protein AB0C04_10215 [Micromonospora sp. NPDC048909]|uniref:hypothetical protein n=1 Tax=Micromonospora sp. NPDC048909 TaxID=3155643 RepID=UPI00340B2599